MTRLSQFGSPRSGNRREAGTKRRQGGIREAPRVGDKNRLEVTDGQFCTDVSRKPRSLVTCQAQRPNCSFISLSLVFRICTLWSRGRRHHLNSALAQSLNEFWALLQTQMASQVGERRKHECFFFLSFSLLSFSLMSQFTEIKWTILPFSLAFPVLQATSSVTPLMLSGHFTLLVSRHFFHSILSPSFHILSSPLPHLFFMLIPLSRCS